MSMLLEALKKAALEKKDRADGKARLSSIAENHHYVSAAAKDPDPTSSIDEDKIEADSNVVENETLLELENQEAREEEKAETESEPEVESVPTSFELAVESESTPEPEHKPEQKSETQQVEDWSDDIDFSELNAQIDTQDDSTPVESQEDLIASIVADALAQTEEKAEVFIVDTPKSNEHTKAALSQLIQKSKTRERAQNRRLLVIFSSLFVVSVSLGALYYYFLNIEDSAFIVAPGTAPALGTTPDMQSDPDTAIYSDSSPGKETEASVALEDKPVSETPLTDEVVVTKESTPDPTTTAAPSQTRPVAKPKKAEPAKKIQPVAAQNPNIIRLDPLPEYIQNAYSAYNVGNYQEAENLYRQAYTLAPQNTDVLLGLAACSIKLNKSEDALLYYKQVLRTKPKDRTALAGLLSITTLQADQPEVESRLRNLINDNPNDAHLYFLLGNLYLSQQKWSGANIQFNKAASLEARNADYLYNLAISYDQLGQTQEALRYYEEAYNFAQPGQASFSLTVVNNRIRTLLSDQ